MVKGVPGQRRMGVGRFIGSHCADVLVRMCVWGFSRLSERRGVKGRGMRERDLYFSDRRTI